MTGSRRTTLLVGNSYRTDVVLGPVVLCRWRAANLEVVDAPRSECLCIDSFVADGAWVATTCHSACARIDTELEA